MGQKLKIWATMTSMILLSGILGFGSSAYAQESPADLPPQAEAGAAKGCEESGDRSNERASAAARNPHCEEPEPPRTIEGSPCNTNSDFEITSAELQTELLFSVGDANNAITVADTDVSGGVDTLDELALLNTFPGAEGC